MKRLITLATLVLTLALWLPAATAERGQCKGKKGHKKGFWHKLPEAVGKKAAALKLKKMQAKLPLKAQLKLAGAKLRVEITKANPNMGVIKKLIAEKAKLKQKLMLVKVEFKIALQKVLPEPYLTHFRLKVLSGRRGKKGKKGCKKGCRGHRRGRH